MTDTHKQRHKPTDEQREQVKTLSGLGVPQEDICTMIGITEPTLRKHYRTEIDLGFAQANAKIAGSLFKQATSGNTAAAIFWLKARCGWREKHEIVGKDDGPIEVKHFTGVPRPEDFPEETLQAIVESLKQNA